jgi:hypothetical protein
LRAGLAALVFLLLMWMGLRAGLMVLILLVVLSADAIRKRFLEGRRIWLVG